MDEFAAKPSPIPPRRRWWKIAAATVVVVVVALIAALPYWLSSRSGRDWLLSRANRTLSPGRLDVARFGFSWFRPTRLDGFVIRDPQGDKVLESDHAVWDRNLFQILFQRPRYGNFRLNHGVIDVERRADGSIDIIDALRPILNGTPPTDWTIHVVDGTLRVRSPGLAEPIAAKAFDLTIRRPAAPSPITWHGQLDDQDGHTLSLSGTFDRWDGRADDQHDLEVLFQSEGWPLAIAARGVSARTAIEGSFSGHRAGGLWTIGGRADLLDVDATGRALSDDHLRLDRLAGTWVVAQGSTGWTIRSLDLRSPVGSLHASGPVPATAGQSSEIVGTLDLAGISKRLPRTTRLKEGVSLDRGTADLKIVAKTDGDRHLWTGEARISDLAAHSGENALTLREPATLSALVVETDGAINVDHAAIRSAFLNVDGRGDLDRGVTLTGDIDLAGLSRQLADFVDLGRFALAGRGRIEATGRREASDVSAGVRATFDEASLGPEKDPLLLRGLTLAATARGRRDASLSDWRFDTEVGVTSATRAGLALGPTTFKGRREARAFVFEPIETTLNGGRLHLVPDLVTDPGLMVRLKPGSELIDAEVNEEATRRVLSFVAPVLDGATRVTGRVSARIDRGEFPIGEDAKKKTVVEGKVVFQDLVFAPGPLALSVLEMVNRRDATMRLDQPVVLSISDGMIHQTGLALPVGDLTKVAIEGSVGFDRSLDLVATIPITPAMFPGDGPVSQIVSGSRVTVPIRGTLDKPQIDREAFRAGLADMGKGLLIKGATRGAAELLFRLAQPRDPNAPPPPTAAERRAMRQERRLQRRGGP